jgi:spermidine dehydrogenase
MERRITRRDFVNGVSVALTGSLLAPAVLPALSPAGQTGQRPYYPPAQTGMRGAHRGSFEVAHGLRDGRSWDGDATDTGESFDLVVVGGGLSGLSAAYFFRKAFGPNARILILDNHDDFGGHAKRNEFRHQGRLLLMNGGTLNIEAPSQYSEQAMGLLREIGIDPDRYDEARRADRGLYRSLDLGRGMFFDKETFGTDRLVTGQGRIPLSEFLAKTPLAEDAQGDILRLQDGEVNPDPMAGLSSAEKKARLAKMSYRDFLLDVAQVHPDVIKYYQARTHGLFCVGIDAVPALYCWNMGYPGFRGLGLEPTPPENLIGEPGGQHGRENQSRASRGRRSLQFPDGNATIARLLVRGLLPDAVPGKSMEDVITAGVDYSRLDRDSEAVKIRLSSTAVRVRHEGDPESADRVLITYVTGGNARQVSAARCVLACWNGVIPYLCPELPAHQKEALAYGVKQPIVYTSVLMRNWSAFQSLGINSVSAPGSYHTSASLAAPISLGEYRTPQTPDQPIAVHLVRTPCSPGKAKREQHRVGQHDLLTTTFQTFERKIRDQFGRMLSGGGFDPARDITAITVNRWPHGYAYTYNTLYDPAEWALGTPDDRPCVIGRRTFGRIAIANSDAAASPHTDAAIDEAYRAVREIIR